MIFLAFYVVHSLLHLIGLMFYTLYCLRLDNLNLVAQVVLLQIINVALKMMYPSNGFNIHKLSGM